MRPALLPSAPRSTVGFAALLIALMVPSRAVIAQAAAVTRNVYLRHDPSTAHPAIHLLHVGDTIALIRRRPVGGFYRVAAGSDTGYAWGRNLHILSPSEVAALRAAPPAHGRTCSDAHYRWAEKTDPGGSRLTPQATTIHAMLTSWPVPDLTGADEYWCSARTGREEGAVTVLGWVRRIKMHETDGDWHIELTETASIAPTNHCIVVEIPPTALEPAYAAARRDLQQLVQAGGGHVRANGDVVPAVQLRFTGRPFFDGEHRSGATNRAHAHGRCNSSARALWEIHPVTKVAAP